MSESPGSRALDSAIPAALETGKGTETDHDVNAVDFSDSPDPANPVDWSPGRKWAIVILISLVEFVG
jgi:hypothetical protein